MAKKAKAEQAKKLPKVGCPKCHDGGFGGGMILVTGENGDRYAKECECLLAYQAAKKALEVKTA